MPQARYLTDPRVVFSPHLYSGSINVSNDVPSVEQGFRIAKDAANSYDAPLWTGEWGWWSDPARRASDVRRFMRAADAYRICGAWWSWKQACGDPHAVAYGTTRQDQEQLNLTHCPSGRLGGLDRAVAAVLSQPYPRAVPGTLTRLDASGFSGVGTGMIDAWVPGARRPQPRTTGVTSPALTRVAGGWRWSGRTGGRYSVSY